MLEFDGGITYIPEMVQPPIVDTVVNVDLEDQQQHEQVMVREVGVTDVAPNQYTDRATVHEMPASHPNIDEGTVTIGGLRKCPYYAELAKTNPELALASATEARKRVQERETMQEQGMSESAIKRQQWSSMRERHKERVKAEEKLIPEKAVQEVEVEPAQRHTAEQRIVATDVESASTVSRHEVAEKSIARQPETLPPAAQAPVKEAVVRPMRELAEMSVVAQTAQTARVEVVIDPNTDRIVPVQDTVAIEATYGRVRLGEQPEAVLDSTVPIDYQPSPNQLLLGDSVYTAGVLVTEESAPSSIATKPSLEGSEIAEVVSMAAAKLEQPETLKRTTWEDVLEKEPLELYEDFTKVLRSLITPSEEAPLAFNETADTNEPVVLVNAVQELQPPFAIAVTIVERLIERTVGEKETIAPALKEIVKAVQAVDLLRATEAKPEAIETAQSELEELITILFEQLGIAYESEDIKRFAVMLLRPDFQLQQAEEPVAVDLEHEGTHEAKLDVAQLISDGLSGVDEAVERLLGKVVVFYAAHHSLPEYELAAA